MTFLWPPLLLAVLLVPAGLWLAVRIDRRRRARVADLSGSVAAQADPEGGSGAGPPPVEGSWPGCPPPSPSPG